MSATTHHPSPVAGNTQCAAILEVLVANRGEWVPMPKLAEASGAYAVHSRISDLRKRRGHNIEQKNETRGRTILSFYKLI